MFENVNLSNNQNMIKADDKKVKSSQFSKYPSFKGNPNAVDTTPASDSYVPNGETLPPEMSFGEKFVKYMFPTWMSLHYGTKLFDKANSGEYEKSLVGRLGHWGDKLSETPLIRNRFMDSLKSHLSDGHTKFKAFVERHPILNAMDKTPTSPECPLVTNFLETQAEADVKEASSKLMDFVEKGPRSLKEAGATKEEIRELKAKYKTNIFGQIKNKEQALREFQIKKMGFDPATIPANEPMKNVRLSYLGLNEAALETIKKEPNAYKGEIEAALNKSKAVSPKISTYLNKLLSISKPTTKLGRFLPKAAKLGMRGLTFGGGLFNSLFVAFFLADAVKNTVDAPKEQKTGTFVSGLVEAMSWVIAMPISLKAMHAVNGIKNLGKSKEQVSIYKSALKAFNEKVKSGKLLDKTLYDQAFNELMSLKNVGTKQKGLSKVVSKIAQFLSIGLEQPARYRESVQGFGKFGANIKNWAKPENLAAIGRNIKRNLPNIGKNIVGYPLRFALYAAIFAPIVDKAFSFVTNAIFGKPYEPEKIREEQEKAKEEAEMEALRKKYLYPGPALTPNPEAVNGLDKVDVDSLSDNNLAKQELMKNGYAKPRTNTTSGTAQNVYTNSVNGIQIDVKHDADPFMPPAPNSTNNGYGVPNSTINEKDPNISDYDTVPRSYIPSISSGYGMGNNEPYKVPYTDPYMAPNYERNYENLSKSINSTEKFIEETEKMIDNKFRD